MRGPRKGGRWYAQRSTVDRRNDGGVYSINASQNTLVCLMGADPGQRDMPGSIIDHGDLNNRVKMLTDGMRKPKAALELGEHTVPADGEDLFYVLLEDDDLIIGLTVETVELFTPPGPDGENDCHAVVTVEIKPFGVSMFNLGFY